MTVTLGQLMLASAGIPRHLLGTRGLAGVISLGLASVLLAGLAGSFLTDGTAMTSFDNLHWTAAAALAVLLTIRGALRSSGREQRLRLGFAIGMLSWLGGQLAWDLQSPGGSTSGVAPSDALYLGCAVPVVLVLVVSVRGVVSRVEETSAYLDSGSAFLALTAAFVAGAGLRFPHQPVLSLAIASLYPIAYLSTTAAGLVVLVSVGGYRARPSNLGFLAAFGLQGVAWLAWYDALYSTGGPPGQVVAALFSLSLVGAAGFASRWRLPDPALAVRRSRRSEAITTLLPVPAVCASLAVLLLGGGDNPTAPVPQLTAACAVLLVVVRQTLLLRERTAFVRRDRERLDDQRRLLKVNEDLLRTASASGVLEAIADTLRTVVPYDTLTIYLADPDRVELIPVLARDRYADLVLQNRLRWGHGITGDAVQRGEAVLINDASADPRAVRVPGTPEDRESLIVAPLISPDGPLGSLNLYRLDHGFLPGDLELARLYASQAAIALETANRHGRLSLAAQTDGLTGLLNRTAFLRVVDDLLGPTPDEVVTVLFLDLDGFKLVNDSLGHAVGDDLLRAVADRLRSSLRPTDAIARVGGDEFAIAARVRDMDEAAGIARRLLAGLRPPIRVGDTEILVRASIGICTSDLAPGRDALLRDADVAMYEAKASGKDRFEVFRPEFHERAVERLGLEHDLRQALEQQEFVVYYQPVVDLRTGAVSGHEALVRWNHPRRGLLLPGEFIGVAEETGLIVPLGRFVLRTAIATLASWRDAGWTGWMSINLAPRQLLESRLGDEVRDLLEGSHVPAASVHLEITESAGLSRDDRARDVLMDLARLGVGIALDDFGTGFSSLQRAAELPITILKVDRSFVEGMGSDRVRTAVAEATVAFGHALGVRIVAEGIETTGQRDLLARLGCEFGQGYLFGRPEPARDGPPGLLPASIRVLRPNTSVA